MATPLSPAPHCFCQRRRSYKQMVQDVAEDLGAEDARKIAFQYDLPRDYGNKPALAALRQLETRGMFSDSDVDSLVSLLRCIYRCDLISKHVMQYKQNFCGCERLRQEVEPVTPSSFQDEEHAFEKSIRLKPEDKKELCHLLSKYVPQDELRRSGSLTKIFESVLPRTFHRRRQQLPLSSTPSMVSVLSLDSVQRDWAEGQMRRPHSTSGLPSRFERENEVEWVCVDQWSGKDSGTCSSTASSGSLNNDIEKPEVFKPGRFGRHQEVLWRIKRDQFMVPLFHHKRKTFEKKIKLCLGRSTPYLSINFKLFPNGLGSDENLYASFRVELPSTAHIPSKATALSFNISVRDLHTADILVSRCMECPMGKECYTLEQFLAHEVIKSSQARHLEISITVRVRSPAQGWVEIVCCP